MALKPGDEVQGLQVQAVLGDGSFARVYRVWRQADGAVFALKVMGQPTDRVRARVQREFELQSALRHPNVVHMEALLEISGGPALLLEYVDGMDLWRWLQAHTLDLAAAEALFTRIVHGVQAAHDAGVVHRDLKPANILIVDGPDGPVPKIADFGYAKILRPGGRGLTGTGTALGTPAYMAPEQIRDAKRVDERADVFSLGVVLYRLVTGRAPFVGSDALEVFNAVVAGDYTPPEAFVPQLPSRFGRAIRGALQTDPAARIASTRSLLAVLHGEASQWTTRPAPPRPRRWGRWLAAGGGVVLLTTTLAVVAGLALGLVGSGAVPALPVRSLPDGRPAPVAELPAQWCAGEGGTTLGWIALDDKREGPELTASQAVDVYAAPPGPGPGGQAGPVICRLDRGEQVVLGRTRSRGGKVWHEVHAR